MLAVLGFYVLVQLLLGLWVARAVRSEDDYLLAGRRLGPVLAISSMFATWFSAESCIGAAGSVYHEGLGLHTVEPFAYGLCLVLLGLLFATRLWRAGITTVADLFQQRFGGSTATLAALLMVPTSLLWAAAQVRAFGHVLALHADGWFGAEAALAIATAVVLAYTVAGGLLADVVTDLVQGVALVLGIAAMLVAVVLELGGPAAAADAVASLPPRAPASPPGALDLCEAWAIPVLGSIAAQEAVSRSLATRAPSLARSAGVAGGALYLLVGLMPVALGLLGPALLPGLDDGEQLLPALASRMPGVIQVLFTGALVSAMLSTVDSTLLAASSVLTRNVLLRQREIAPRRRLLTARLASLGCGLAAYGLAHAGSVSELVEEASGFGSAGIFVLLVVALYRRPRRAAVANACLLCGLGAWVLGRYVLALPTPFLVSLLAAASGYTLAVLLLRPLPAPAAGLGAG